MSSMRLSGAFQRLGIRGQLMGVFAAIGVIWIASLAVAASGLLSARSHAQDAAGTFTASQLEHSAYEGWLTQDDQSNMYAGLAALKDPSQAALLDATWAQVLQGHAQAVHSLERLATLVHSPQLRHAVRATTGDLAAYSAFTSRVRADVLGGDPKRAVQVMSVDNAAISNQVQGDFDALATPFATAASGDRTATQRTVSHALTATVAIAIAGLALAGIILALFASSLKAIVDSVLVRLRSLDQHDLADLRDALVAVSNRDLTVGAAPTTEPIPEHRADELGEMTRTFNAMLAKTHDGLASCNAMRERVAQMLTDIDSTTRTVAAASTQIAGASEETGRAVDDIARAVDTVASGAARQVETLETARQITAQVALATRSSAEDAQETVSAAQEARASAADGAAVVERATEAMRLVEATSDRVAEAMRRLDEKSTEIGGIVETITGISEQTNLLALNAAIEAARAGEQGRSFAVVADEVRKLAEETQHAAASITELIAQIQSETASTAEAVELGASQAHESAATVAAAREAFERIDASVGAMSGRVEQIAASIEQIADSGEQMRGSVGEVVAVSEQAASSTHEVSTSTLHTAASAQELAASAQELATTAEELKRLVGQFTLA